MKRDFDRRHFIKQTAAIGAGLYVSGKAPGADVRSKDTIHVALLGAGSQGQVLTEAIIKKKDCRTRFVAVCDIWDFNRIRMKNRLKAYSPYCDYRSADYVDYREMLDAEKDLDAVIIATPDFCHAEQTIACLEKGLHVYCEKPMSNTADDARKMVEAAQQSGKLLQIGHQRRSNPHYRRCYHRLLKEAHILGQITKVKAQWNRSKAACEFYGRPEKYHMDESRLNHYGYRDMIQLNNWQWFKGLGSGPAVALGTHQIDILSWFLDAHPTSVIASGGHDYWKDRQWYDNVTAVYEYQTPSGPVRATYEVCSNSAHDAYFETFMGDRATLTVSENVHRYNRLHAEGWVERKNWEPLVEKGDLCIPNSRELLRQSSDGLLDILDDVRQYQPPIYEIPVEFHDPYHQPHVMNFFNAIRGTETLNCPAETGYNTAVTVLKINDAVAAAKRLDFEPGAFISHKNA